MHCFVRPMPPDVLAADTQSMPQMDGGKAWQDMKWNSAFWKLRLRCSKSWQISQDG